MKMETMKWMSVPLAMGLLMGGCSSSPDVDDEMPVEGAEEAAVAMPDEGELAFDMTPPVVQEAGTTKQAFDDAARWLPAESFFVTSAIGDSIWDEAESLGLPFQPEGLEAGEDGTVEALRQDLEEFMVEILGFDALAVREAVSATTIDGDMMVVMFGEFVAPTHLEAFPVGDYGDAYRVDFGFEDEYDEVEEAYDDVELEVEGFDLSAFAEQDDELYVMPVDEPRPAMLMSSSVETLERMHGGESSMSADSDIGELLERSQGHHTVMAMVGAPLVEELEMDAEEAAMVPELSYLGVADSGLEVTMFGDQEGLDMISMSVGMGVDMLQEGAEAAYETRHERDLFEEILFSHGYHLVMGLQHEMEPVMDDGRLTYELEMAGEPGYLAALMSVASVGLMAWEILSPEEMLEEFLGDL